MKEYNLSVDHNENSIQFKVDATNSIGWRSSPCHRSFLLIKRLLIILKNCGPGDFLRCLFRCLCVSYCTYFPWFGLALVPIREKKLIVFVKYFLMQPLSSES